MYRGTSLDSEKIVLSYEYTSICRGSLFSNTSERNYSAISRHIYISPPQFFLSSRRLSGGMHAPSSSSVSCFFVFSSSGLVQEKGRSTAIEEELTQLRSQYEEMRARVGEAVGRCEEVEDREKQEREGRSLLAQQVEELKTQITEMKTTETAQQTLLKERESLLTELQEQKVKNNKSSTSPPLTLIQQEDEGRHTAFRLVSRHVKIEIDIDIYVFIYLCV